MLGIFLKKLVFLTLDYWKARVPEWLLPGGLSNNYGFFKNVIDKFKSIIIKIIAAVQFLRGRESGFPVSKAP
jgi:hypothetical protein